MTIQWYPGHMLETKKLLKSAISKTDAVLEMIDARCPHASANPLLDKLCKHVFRLKVLNKTDLADPDKTAKWLSYYESLPQTAAISIRATVKQEAVKALDYCVERIKKNRARKIKILVVGIPNTGKSTILNSLVGKKVAKTGNVPAITRHKQRTSLPNNIDIYDTPGILWPIIEPEEKAFRLAASGAISDTAIDYSEVAYFTVQYLVKAYPDHLVKRYPFLTPLPTDAMDIIESIGRSKGCLKKGGIIDFQKASETLIRELRAGKIGQISFETPEDIKDDFSE